MRYKRLRDDRGRHFGNNSYSTPNINKSKTKYDTADYLNNESIKQIRDEDMYGIQSPFVEDSTVDAIAENSENGNIQLEFPPEKRKKNKNSQMPNKKRRDSLPKNENENYNDGFLDIDELTRDNDFGGYQRKGGIFTVFTMIYFPLYIMVNELLIRMACGYSLDMGLLFPMLFALPLAFVFTLICTLFPKKVNKVFVVVFSACITLWYGANIVYYEVFSSYIAFSTIGNGAGQAFNSMDMILTAIQTKAIYIGITVAMLILAIILVGRLFPFERMKVRFKIVLLLLAVLVQCGTYFLCINIDSKNDYYYNDVFISNKATERFGMFTSTSLDIKHSIFGVSSDTIKISNKATESTQATTQTEPEKIEYTDQVLKLDFDAMAKKETNKTYKSMDEYFATVTPTKTNDYTGMFEGKNIILITAEAFSSYSINKDLTPTLYRMYNEGFQFDNFYTTGWYASTSDGEYTGLLSQIPESGTWSFSKSQSNYLPFSIANQSQKNDYETVAAFHAHTYTYYDRDKTVPNLGYDTWLANGNGLEDILPDSYFTKRDRRRTIDGKGNSTWPESDLEMMEASVNQYINSDSFSVYYMTVSQHANYAPMGNYIANKNFDSVPSSLGYSDTVAGYLATAIELDKAMEYLIGRLEKAGKADDTVICINADHYPYGLDETKGLDELAGHKVEKEFERYENSFLLWSGSMEEPIKCSKPACNLDILPTISNLMGFDYDSRLLMGRDIMSDSDPLVIFGTESWITDKGKYNANTGKFTANKGVTVDDDYVETINDQVSAKFQASHMILDNDYFRHILADSKEVYHKKSSN